jgi:hypothetical protein
MTINREIDPLTKLSHIAEQLEAETATVRTGSEELEAYALSNAEVEVNSIELVSRLERERYGRFLAEVARRESEILRALLS